jgi:hypothetical protein
VSRIAKQPTASSTFIEEGESEDGESVDYSSADEDAEEEGEI